MEDGGTVASCPDPERPCSGRYDPARDPAQRRGGRSLRPARRSLRAGRRRRLPRARLSQGGEALPRDRGVGLDAVGAGPPDRARRHRRHDRDEGRRVARDGHDGGAREAARPRAREPRRDRAAAGPRRQDGAPAVAGARHHHAGRARGRPRARAACRARRASASARSSSSSRSSRRAPRRASACSGSIRRSSWRAPCWSRCASTRPASGPTRRARCGGAPRRSATST